MTLKIPCGRAKCWVSADDFSVTPGGLDTATTLAFGVSDETADYDRLGVDDTGNTNEFSMMTDGTVNGFARNVHTRALDNDVTMDTVTVFDNRDDPEAVPYREFYDAAGAMDRTDAQALNAPPNDRDAVNAISADGVLDLDEGNVDGNHDLFSASGFPSREDQTFTYVNDDPETMDVNEEMRGGRDFRGTFNDVPGKFACTGGPGECTAGTDSMGRLDSLAGGGMWTFTPNDVDEDADPHMIAGGRTDDDYLAFGYWLRGTTVRGDTTYGIGTFATGSMPFADTQAQVAVAALLGSATYSGQAAGMFVMKTDFDGDNLGPQPTSAGKFTAEATLTANFGGPTVDGTVMNSSTDFTISGTVDNFQLENYDGRTVDNYWSLDLNMARLATPTYSNLTGAVTGFGTTHGREFGGTTGEMGSQGRWEGTFYGPQVQNDMDTTTVNEAETGFPTGVAGEFIGHFEAGHAIGAFGAELE